MSITSCVCILISALMPSWNGGMAWWSDEVWRWEMEVTLLEGMAPLATGHLKIAIRCFLTVKLHSSQYLGVQSPAPRSVV